MTRDPFAQVLIVLVMALTVYEVAKLFAPAVCP